MAIYKVTEEDFRRCEQVNREILNEDMTEMLRNNPPDVVYTAFTQTFFQGVIRMVQRATDMKSIVLSDTQAWDQATRHFFYQGAARCARNLHVNHSG